MKTDRVLGGLGLTAEGIGVLHDRRLDGFLDLIECEAAAPRGCLNLDAAIRRASLRQTASRLGRFRL